MQNESKAAMTQHPVTPQEARAPMFLPQLPKPRFDMAFSGGAYIERSLYTETQMTAYAREAVAAALDQQSPAAQATPVGDYNLYTSPIATQGGEDAKDAALLVKGYEGAFYATPSPGDQPQIHLYYDTHENAEAAMEAWCRLSDAALAAASPAPGAG